MVGFCYLSRGPLAPAVEDGSPPPLWGVFLSSPDLQSRRNVSDGIAPIAEVTTEELKEQIIEIKSLPTKRGTGL